ncbi:MAG: glycosyltransferase family 2 protein [Deltaproteobacteria bacterium]|nr:glycosyltransferase family 2 protein [Deltaproteobacteria bacterium]
MPPRSLLAVLIVNYNTTALTRSCVASLHAQTIRSPDGTNGAPQIVVFDNASRTEERQALLGIAAQVIYNDDNRGYGAALNQAVACTDSEYVLFSNADTWYCPGALQALIDEARSLPRWGAIGPRIWWDRERNFLLPPSDPVTLSSRCCEAILGKRSEGQRWLQRSWRKRALDYWRTQRPLSQALLSGACLLTKREVLAACGGFDERFRLYYEDTDWCRRVRQKGYRLYCVPTADVVHLHNQSARQERETAQLMGAESETRYFQKYYGAWIGTRLDRLVTPWRMNEDEKWQSRAHVDCGTCQQPPHFSLSMPLQGEYLWQLSPFPSCVPAIARFVTKEEELRLPQHMWNLLSNGAFYAGLFSLPTIQPVQYWRWQKTSSPE